MSKTIKETRKYFSSINYLGGDIPCYEIVIDESFDKAFPVVRQEKALGFPFPERQEHMITCLVRQDSGEFGVRQLYAEELFETYEEAAQDCLRRLDYLNEQLTQEIRRLQSRKRYFDSSLMLHDGQ